MVKMWSAHGNHPCADCKGVSPHKCYRKKGKLIMLFPSLGSRPGTRVSNRRNNAGFKLCESKNYFSFTGDFKIERNCDNKDSHLSSLCLMLQEDHINLFCSEHNYDLLYNMQSLHQFVAEFPHNIHPAVEVQRSSSFKNVSMSTNLATILALAIYVPCLLTKS
jgi:hypothetical protein